MSANKFPSDYWHTYVYVHFSWLSCFQCDTAPDLEWAWTGIEVEGEEAVARFTIRAVEYLKHAGWVMHQDQPHCPGCAAKL